MSILIQFDHRMWNTLDVSIVQVQRDVYDSNAAAAKAAAVERSRCRSRKGERFVSLGHLAAHLPPKVIAAALTFRVTCNC